MCFTECHPARRISIVSPIVRDRSLARSLASADGVNEADERMCARGRTERGSENGTGTGRGT